MTGIDVTPLPAGASRACGTPTLPAEVFRTAPPGKTYAAVRPLTNVALAAVFRREPPLKLTTDPVDRLVVAPLLM